LISLLGSFTVEGIRTPGMPSTTVVVLNVLLGSIGAGYMVDGRRNNHLQAHSAACC
jgi:hypothetical protein